MSRLALCVLVVFIGAVYCNHLSEEVQLGSFEGTYKIDGAGYLYVCQDGVVVQGAYNEVGIIRGGVTGDQLTGNFYSAGLGPCVLGTVTADLEDYGILAGFRCNDQVNVAGFTATKISGFRPTDTQCGLGDPNNDGNSTTVQGAWEDDHGRELHLCFIDSDTSNTTVHGSLQRVNSEGEVVDWYVSGYWVDGGKIVLGTWYEDFSAGAILFYLRDNGKIEYYWWTGLIYDQGQTVIDLNQLNNPAKHGVGSFKEPDQFRNYPGRQTTGADCEQYSGLEEYVLRNLDRNADNDYYYFIDVEYLDYIYNIKPVLDTASGASTLAVSIFTLFVSIFALF